MPEPLSGPISKRRFLRVMALGAAASVLAACGTAQAPAAPTAPAAKPTDAPKPAAPTAAAASTTAAAAPTSGAAATSAPAAAAQPTEAAKPGAARSGGTFTYAEAGDFTNFNPWNFSAVNFGMYDQVFSRLLWKDGAGKANPDLAESWQLAPDNLSIRLKLRSGLKWHDDKAVATQDFVDMFGYLKDDALATDLSVMKIKGIMGPVKEVTAPDASTVQLSFSSPVPYITDILDYWFLIRISDKSDPQFVKQAPVGTGPFKMAEWVPQQFARFTRFGDYWNKDLPTLDEFLFKRLTQAETLLPNLKSGTLDGVLLTSFSDVAPLQADKTYAVDVNDNAGSIFNMQVNINKPPLDKKEVRQALSYSLNRVELVKTAFFGVSKPITTTFYSPASLGYREDLVMAHPFDLAHARSPSWTRSMFRKQFANRRGYDCQLGPAVCGVSTTFGRPSRDAGLAHDGVSASTAAAILRTRSGSLIESISTILPAAMVKPITVTGSPARVMTTPAAPFTTAWCSCVAGRARTERIPARVCLATASAPRIVMDAAGRRVPASIRTTTFGSSRATRASKSPPRAAEKKASTTSR